MWVPGTAWSSRHFLITLGILRAVVCIPTFSRLWSVPERLLVCTRVCLRGLAAPQRSRQLPPFTAGERLEPRSTWRRGLKPHSLVISCVILPWEGPNSRTIYSAHWTSLLDVPRHDVAASWYLHLREPASPDPSNCVFLKDLWLLIAAHLW